MDDIAVPVLPFYCYYVCQEVEDHLHKTTIYLSRHMNVEFIAYICD